MTKDEAKRINEKLNDLLLDLYPLTIANAPLSVGEQRKFADNVAAHIRVLLRLTVKGMTDD